MKRILILIIFFLLISVVYFSIRIFIGYRNGYNYEIMDWNQDGKTSISEIVESSDIGVRQTTINEIRCIEYFSYKDGLPIKVVCPREVVN